MARHVRTSAAPKGQFHSELRGRDSSGLLLHHLDHLRQVIAQVGDPVFVSHHTAAALHRIDGFELAPPFHLTVPRGRNITRFPHIVHTTTSLDLIDRESSRGLAITAPTRTLIDLAGHISLDEAHAALDSMLRDGLSTEDFLHRRIHDLRGRGRYGIPLLLEAVERSESGRGCHSWLEREYQRLLQSARLPAPVTQQVMGRRGAKLIRVDFSFPDTPVIVEVLGYRWHRTTAQMAVDAARMNELVLAGKVPLQFTYDQIVGTPELVVDSTRRALAPYLPAASVSPHRPTQRL